MTPSTSPQRLRTCRSCGQHYEYPVKENPATRHHCSLCTGLPETTRRTMERLNERIRRLELTLNRLAVVAQ